ncbi:hypothetical protein KR032_004187 [Drosophila birchii]|nr:hypothetical protein KR032_004187 [Drosophila birchii]
MRRPQLFVMTTLLLLLAFFLVSPTLGQVPLNECFPQFQYHGYRGQYIGQVSVRLDPRLVNHELHLEFSQQGLHDFTAFVGTISVAEDEAKDNIQTNQPVAYRVDFPLPASPPKITSIQVNGVELCSAEDFPKPRTGITLVHTLTLLGNGVQDLIPNPIRSPNRTPTRPTAQPPLIFTSDWETSFPTRTPTRNPNRSPNRNPEVSNVFQTNDTFLGPERELQPISGSRARPNQAASESWLTTSPPQVNNRETLVTQLAPPSSGSIQCGRERATTTPLVFQGTRLQRGQIPWLVGMFERRESNGPIFFCGGSLIGISTVLTAAHCFRIPGFRDLPASRTAVSLGRNSLDLLSDGEFRSVSQLLIHDKYQYEQYTEADLALVRMETPVPLNDYIVPICLWSSANRLDLPQGEKTYVAGWGPDESGTGNSDIAKLADMNIVSEANCHRQLPPGPLFQPSTLCAQKAGTGPCSTDGGGPLMLREGGVFVLRGVIAGGAHDKERNTCDLSRPSVFTDVAKHIDWVRRNMWN